MDYLEIVGTAIGVAYLYLEYKASIWLWIAGIIMPAVYLVVYYRAGLYADFGINVYYAGLKAPPPPIRARSLSFP